MCERRHDPKQAASYPPRFHPLSSSQQLVEQARCAARLQHRCHGCRYNCISLRSRLRYEQPAASVYVAVNSHLKLNVSHVCPRVRSKVLWLYRYQSIWLWAWGDAINIILCLKHGCTLINIRALPSPSGSLRSTAIYWSCCIHDSVSICRYICHLLARFSSDTAIVEAEVNPWVDAAVESDEICKQLHDQVGCVI